MELRIGNGYDVHALAPGLPMWLGGVRIPSETGFVAHSDGDVDGTNEKAKAEGKYVPGSSIRGAWRDGNYKRTRSTASRTQAIIGLITLLLIAAVLIYITKIYSLIGA